MTSPPTPLPALHHTAPVYGGAASRRKLGKGNRNAFSLDGYLSSTSPRTPPLPAHSAATPTGLPQQNGLFRGATSDRSDMSPAEALLAGDGALAPLSVSSSQPYSYASALWRSQLLQCETQLRELVAQGVHEPPSLERTLQVMSLYDQVASEVQVHQGNTFLGTLLRLFRVEFCRSIFLDGSGPAEGDAAPAAASLSLSKDNSKVDAAAATAGYDGLPQTYFEETASLQRTKAALTSTLAGATSGETLRLLERQLEDRGEQVTWYECELERVRHQYEQVAEECLSLRKTLDVQHRETAATQKRLQQDIQTLHVENKDLQIQLFRLRKQISGGMSSLLKDSYRQLKLSKMGLTQSLFNEGDERVALLVFLGQVESRVNEVLDSYDNDFVLRPENDRRELQLKMAQNVSVLLEDMHYCEASYRRLIGAHHVRIVERGQSMSGAASGRGGDGLLGGLSTAAPLQRIPGSLVHSGKDEEAPDESDGYVAILFDPKIYDQFQGRHAVQARLQQYKKDRDEDAKSSGGKAKSEYGRFSITSTDGGFATATAAGAGANKTLTRPDALSTLLSGMFGADPSAGKRQADPGGGTLAEMAVASITAMPSREEKMKKWSLDSCSFGIGASSLNGRPAPPFAVSSTSTRSEAAPTKLERPPPLPGRPARPAGFGTVVVSPPESNEPTQQQHNATAAPEATPVAQEVFEDVVERQKAEWVAQILGPPTMSVAFTVPGRHPEKGDVVVVHERSAEVVPAELMMRRVLRHPMEDLGYERFLSTVEVFTGENPTQQRLLCRVNHIDPSLPIQLPESTNFVKVKYALTKNAVSPEVSTRGAGSVVATTNAGTGAAGGVNTATAVEEEDKSTLAVFRGNPDLRLFKALGSKGLVDGNLGLQYCAGAVNSTTASTVAFQRLHPTSPNRAPEWLLYQQLFGSYRSLTPRMMEVTTIDHVMACAAERYFTRMEYRYDECYLRAAGQCTNYQVRRDMTERLFKDLYVLSDFQEALVDELEARYGFPELVAKILYEMLCYLNAVSEKDKVFAAYLSVIRGFAAPTEIHFMSYMLYHLSYCWPESNPSTPVAVEDVRTVLEYVYRNASTIMLIKPEAILNDYDMATRSAPMNFVNFRQFIASTMTHQEEPILLHLHGLFHTYTQHALVDEAGWEAYEVVIGKLWRQKDERRSMVRYLTSCLGVNRTTSLTLSQLTLLAASAWSSNLWE
ncbi:hypothetical protein ABB37_00517 [Leptomonas pyrrhocoris]|uniref:Uncharacterized protein n=1 Tax=Leptomonas pyrrhocoris TaxID=157538 RepID=A0A0N1J5H1_LEPPY|nr:hypothetical protein ABB37_00517 [Leptomonas pyrrhocoris]KPA86294.1 hypothetical protein ABB37_00517 [Leptomonas pyrrhocoris]|eukprot:XP_015664733.1 hypothetical protein ABB37_00517 [Leptomonas pyrrhocoris]